MQTAYSHPHSHTHMVGHYQAPETTNGSEPDVLIGAYLMAHLRDVCENCFTTDTYDNKSFLNFSLN